MTFNGYQNSSVGIGGVSIVSSGHIFANEGRSSIRPAGRDDYLLIYVYSGNEDFYFDRRHTLSEGSFVFYRPHEMQKHIHSEVRKAELYYIHFNAPDDFDLFGFKSSFPYQLNESSAFIKDTFEEIINELQQKESGYEYVCCAKLYILFTFLKRKTTATSDKSSQYRSRLANVVQLMNREFFKNYTLDEYAAMCNISKFHFSRIFKATVGVSPLEYRNTLRLEHAKEMLTGTTATVSEIALATGFSSNAYFCDNFKKHFGCAPSEYRKK